jgi:Protein of unknown function (DUF550)
MDSYDLIAHIKRQIEWSEKTFGPGDRTEGIIDHIKKELEEIALEPSDTEEWVDVIILAIDGAWRNGATAEQIVSRLHGKQLKNEQRKWPDWRTVPKDRAIEHIRN